MIRLDSDVLVIGAGGAGMYAAIAAARDGCRVHLIDRSLIGRGGGALSGRPIRASLDECDGAIDLAVVLTPAPSIPDIFVQCARRGVKRIVVESGGFNELGEEGQRLADELVRLARELDLRFIGPNCIGVVDNHRGLCVSFPAMPHPPHGPVSVITQSGGMGLLYAEHLMEEGTGMAKFASVGNKLDVNETDLIPFLAQDERTSVILAYLESMPDGRRLFEAIRACDKPVVVNKSNITAASAAIAGSHTAALMNNDAVVSAALRQAGAIRADRLDETVAAVKAFLLPPMRGDRVVVVSRSGGEAIIAADWCTKAGMTFAKLPQSFFEYVRQLVRADVINLSNPLDMGDVFDVDAYLAIMDGAMALPDMDGVVYLFPYLSAYETGTLERLAQRAAELTKRYGLPLALVLHSWPEETARAKRQSPFPIFDTVEDAVNALAIGRDRWRFRQKAPRKTPRVTVNEAAKEIVAAGEGEYLRQHEAFALLDVYGIPHPPVVLAKTAKEAVRAAEGWGGRGRPPRLPSAAGRGRPPCLPSAVGRGRPPCLPVVLKVESPDAVHKTEAGGILLDLRGASAIRAGFAKLQANLAEHSPQARFDGALVMPMAPPGLELIAGAKRDPSFGPVVLLGWGGTLAEAMEKVSLRLAPLTAWEARQMIDELPGQKLLRGFRGGKAIDRRALADLLVRLGQLACLPGLAEIDLNPVRVYGDGVLALDARVRRSG